MPPFVEITSQPYAVPETSSTLTSSDSSPATTTAEGSKLHSNTEKHGRTTVINDVADVPPVPVDEGPPATTMRRPTPRSLSTPRRSSRTRVSKPIYNLAKLLGTDGHGKRHAKGDTVADRKRRRADSGHTLPSSIEAAAGKISNATKKPNKVAKANTDALKYQQSSTAINTPTITRGHARQSPRTTWYSSGGASTLEHKYPK